MKMTKRVLVLIFSLFFSIPILAAPFKQIITLGDSLSDNGNLLQVMKIVPKSPPYFEGRFSNGPTWAEDVGKYYYDRYGIESKNYAYGGATAVLHDVSHDSFIAPMLLDGEMVSYELFALFHDKSQVLYMIWIGANDYLYDHSNQDELTDRVVKKTADVIKQLVNEGAKHFLVLNLPDFAKTPYAKSHQEMERLHRLGLMHNQKLAETIKNLKAQFPAVNFVAFDVYSIFDDLIANPAKYNATYGKSISNLTDPCWTGTIFGFNQTKDNIKLSLQHAFAQHENVENFDVTNAANTILHSPALLNAYKVGQAYETGATRCENPNAYVFWDDLHPTAAVHEVLADAVVKALLEAGEG